MKKAAPEQGAARAKHVKQTNTTSISLDDVCPYARSCNLIPDDPTCSATCEHCGQVLDRIQLFELLFGVGS